MVAGYQSYPQPALVSYLIIDYSYIMIKRLKEKRCGDMFYLGSVKEDKPVIKAIKIIAGIIVILLIGWMTCFLAGEYQCANKVEQCYYE